jgi:VanZ family protein
MTLTILLVLIVYGSLFPFQFHRDHTPILAWTYAHGADGIRDTVLNLIVYLPVGYMVARRSRRPVLTATLLVGAISGFCECLQAFDQGRVSSLPDWLLNTTGGALGPVIAARLGAALTPEVGVVALAVLARTFPFFPDLHQHIARFHIDQMLFTAVDWLAINCAVRSSRKLALLILVVPAQGFLLDQSTSLGSIAGALLALALSGWKLRPQQLAPVMLLSVIARELAPFTFVSLPVSFHWVPFETFLDGGGAGVFLSKLSLYVLALWLLSPDTKGLWRTAACVSGLLLVLELIQCYIPGRTPDISDAVIVLIAAACLAELRHADSAAAQPLASRMQSGIPIP